MAPPPPKKGGPPLTFEECERWNYQVKKEKKLAYTDARKRIGVLPDLHKKNTYLSHFKDDSLPDGCEEHKFTFDQVKDATPSHQKVPRDTFHPKSSPTSRKNCTVSFTSGWRVRTSQAYGWLPPIDEPQYGFGRSSLFESGSQDKSHCVVGEGPNRSALLGDLGGGGGDVAEGRPNPPWRMQGCVFGKYAS